MRDEHSDRGILGWIGLRSSDRSLPMVEVQTAVITADQGLQQDRYRSGPGPRQVTLFQLENLPIFATRLHLPEVKPSATRRNLGVSGIDIMSLIHHSFQIGECVLFATGDCAPCERMETTVGRGAEEAMAGMGGITARVIKPGRICVGDSVTRLHSSTHEEP